MEPAWVKGFLRWARQRGLAAQTLANYANFARLYARFLEERGLADPCKADRAVIGQFAVYLMTASCRRGRPYTAASRVVVLACLKQIYAHFVGEQRILIDPTAGLAVPRVKRRLPRALLSAREMRRLLTAPDTTTPVGLRDRAILEVLYGTGLRYSEIANLMVHDVDLEERVVWVRRGKGGKDRVLPLGRWAAYWLGRYVDASDSLRRRRGSDRLFLGVVADRPSNIVLNDMLKAHARRARITKPVTLHAIRHTFATLLLKGGADLRNIQRMLGHDELSSTEIYTHLDLASLRRVQERCHPREKRRGRRSGGTLREKRED